ncbi:MULTISPECIES: hypothetical protein [Winogradskyella]|uniref:Uncharacterized protein n=2 Tax=Winogradskyella TaxID=286104 RepID=A0A368ZLI6_9FLAO|nr:hypothetical protein [Winogradskyella arenosi]RCW93436.1 hypothetical protein DFQ08_101230 [Winogradskyella arenosi]
MKTNLINVRKEVESYASQSKLTELEVVEKLKDYYFNKKVNENLTLYKKGKKKVSEINRDLKISSRRFYAILDKKNISYTKYNKSKNKEQVE